MIILRDNRILLRKMVYAVWRAGLVGALQAPLPADASGDKQGETQIKPELQRTIIYLPSVSQF